jgi:hypothetical protein
MDWHREPLTAFFRGPVLRTPEALIFLLGSVLSLLFALMAWLAPEWTFISQRRLRVAITLFALWPICLFTICVRMCAPDFRPRVLTTLFLVAAAVVPFWLAYRNDAI